MRPAALTVAAISAVVAAALPASAARAQRLDPVPSRFAFGLVGVVMHPRGSFGRNVDNGLGIGGHLLVRLDRRGIVALRGDVAGTQYGSERQRAGYDPYFGGRVGLGVTTRNSITWVGIGPELSVPLGPVRPYVNAAVGYSRFSTVSALEGDGYDAYGNYVSRREIASTENQSDGAATRAAGAGVYVAVGPRSWLASAHLGVRYHDGGEASYLREGSITDNPDGTVTVTPLHSRTPFVTSQAGISVAFPTRRR
jgi:hypothetical protein